MTQQDIKILKVELNKSLEKKNILNNTGKVYFKF